NKNSGPVHQDRGRRTVGAGEGNRTLVSCLGSNSSTIELHPRDAKFNAFAAARGACGQKFPPSVANTVVLLPPVWPAVRLVPRLASRPIIRVRAPRVTVP